MKESQRKRKTRSKKTNNTSLLFKFFLFCVLLVFVIFTFINRDKIGQRSLPSTSLAETEKSTTTQQESQPTIQEAIEEPAVEVTVVKTKDEPSTPSQIQELAEKKANESEKSQPQDKTKSLNETKKEKPSDPVSPQIKTEERQLFFVKYSESAESIEVVPILRRISYESSPLTQTLNTLLFGPNSSELKRDLVSMIPNDTQIYSIRIDKGIASIDFNEAFMFNANGREGMEAQLAQIVFTATQFPTVSAVQFLVEGEKRAYLNDGIYIGEPLSRSSF